MIRLVVQNTGINASEPETVRIRRVNPKSLILMVNYDRLYSCIYAPAVSYGLGVYVNYTSIPLKALLKPIGHTESYLRNNLLSMKDIGLYRGWKRGTGVDKIENTYFWRTNVTTRFGKL